MVFAGSQLDPDHVATCVARVRARIDEAAARSGRPPGAVRMLAAVKYVDAAGCAVLARAGVTDLAENRLDALVANQESQLPELSGVDWHFIGRLQSRQAPEVCRRVSMVHSLCSTSAAGRCAGLVQAAQPQLLVQVNVGEDPAKDGLPVADVERFLLELPDVLEVRGLMTMPAFAEDAERSRPAFAALRALRDELAPRLVGRHELVHLSMGTSQDYLVAVEEGATHVRLGRILYDDVESET